MEEGLEAPGPPSKKVSVSTLTGPRIIGHFLSGPPAMKPKVVEERQVHEGIHVRSGQTMRSAVVIPA